MFETEEFSPKQKRIHAETQKIENSIILSQGEHGSDKFSDPFCKREILLDKNCFE